MRARVDVLLAERERLRAALLRLACVEEIFPSRGNFLLVKFLSGPQVMQATASQGIKLRSRDSEVENSVRITVGRADENDRLIRCLSEVRAP
jgi:histidinol-phosphate aminotransferase